MQGGRPVRLSIRFLGIRSSADGMSDYSTANSQLSSFCQFLGEKRLQNLRAVGLTDRDDPHPTVLSPFHIPRQEFLSKPQTPHSHLIPKQHPAYSSQTTVFCRTVHGYGNKPSYKVHNSFFHNSGIPSSKSLARSLFVLIGSRRLCRSDLSLGERSAPWNLSMPTATSLVRSLKRVLNRLYGTLSWGPGAGWLSADWPSFR